MSVTPALCGACDDPDVFARMVVGVDHDGERVPVKVPLCGPCMIRFGWKGEGL